MQNSEPSIPEETRHARKDMPILVAYDISDNRRRTRLYRLLRGFGEPIQKSVFLCWLDPARRRKLNGLLEKFTHIPHKGQERIDCIPARAADLLGMPVPPSIWIVE